MENNRDFYSNSNMAVRKNGPWIGLSIVFYFLSVVMAYKGFQKILVYDSDSGVNAYVGGDAYNYIINSGYATAFFVLAGTFAIMATLFIVIRYLAGKNV